ncbi:bundle-forming pilus extension ATPase [Escherichia coli]
MMLNKTEKTSDLMFERFKRNVSEIVTGDGGELELTVEQRKYFLIFKNGDFLVSSCHMKHHLVQMLREIATRKGYPNLTIYEVNLKDIRLLYEASLKTVQNNGQDLLPVEKRASMLLFECAEMRVSDLHIKVYDAEADIYIRKDGDMELLRQIESNTAHSILASLYNNADDSDATYKINAYQAARIVASKSRLALPPVIQAVRLQFNPLGQGGRYLIARFLYTDKSEKQKEMDPTRFGFHHSHAESFSRMRNLPIGINIISGPTGSGKSTTLKNLLELLYIEKKKKVNIISIEDPPEYEIDGTAQLPITNVETEAQRGEEYRKAITAALRSDPDIIMPGEARDAEVINLLFTAAMTGHQVWTSLHANNALAIFDRLKDQGVDEFKLTDPELITGLVAQRLVRKLCAQCSITLTEYIASGGEISDTDRKIISGHETSVRFPNPRAKKCCRDGYNGRTILAEVIEPDSKLLRLVAEGQREDAQHYWLTSLHGMALKEHAWLKIISGEICVMDAVNKISGIDNITEERKKYLFSRDNEI